MLDKNKLKELFISLFIDSDEISHNKELENIESIFSSLDLKSTNFTTIESTKRKNCIYARLDLILINYCSNINLNISLFHELISIIVLIDVYSACFFLNFENKRNIITLDKLLNNRNRYTRSLVKKLIISDPEKYMTYFKISDKEILVNFLTDMILIRYSYKSNLFNFIFNKSWSIELDKNLLETFWKLNYINIDVRGNKKFIKLEKDPTIGNIVDNSSFNGDIWIEKFNLIKKNKNELKEIVVERDDFLRKENISIFKILKIINFLNNSRFKINKEVLFKLKNNKDLLDKLKDNKKIISLLALKEAEFVSRFDNFYFDYVMDNRTRLYIKNIPLNTQLEKILRPVVTTEIEDDDKIILTYKKFLKEYNKVVKINNVLNVLNLEESEMIKMLEFIESKLKLKKIITKNIIKSFKEKSLSIELIFFQQVYDIKERFGLNLEKLLINDKNELDEIAMNYELKEWLNNDKKWLNSIWYNDASSNVLQILLLKLFIWDDYTLKVCNIFNNDTGDKDIYDSVLKKLKKDDKEFLSRKLIKKIIMPGIYGQTFISLKENFEEILRENKEWNELSKENKIKIIKEINKGVWDELSELKINLSDYLEILKRLPYETKEIYWENMIGMPILLDKEKSLDRKKILEKIKNNKIKKKEDKNKKLKEILNKDDSNYLRKNIKIDKKKYIKLRFKLKSNKLDKKSLSNAITPSSNHADDAAILFTSLEILEKYKITACPIHDSIGTMIYYSSLNKIVFKISNLNFIEFLLKKDNFPFDILRRLNFKKKDLNIKIKKLLEERDKNKIYYLENKEVIFKKLIESKNFFN